MITNRWSWRQELTKTNILKFSQNLEQNIQEEIEEAYPYDWDENYITRRLCRALRKISYSQIELQNTFANVFIAAFKLKGTNENKFGDIGIVLDLQFKDSDRIKGVAFLEAKMRYDNSNDYTALKWGQLRRLYSNAPSSRLLLYNYHPMSSLAPTGIDSKSGGAGLLPKLPATYTSVIPINTAIHVDKKNDRLHKMSIPFSYQFAFRYLFGMDLEFDEEKIDAAKGYLRGNNGLPDYTIMVTVTPGKRDEKEAAFPELNINRELYGEIQDTDNLR